MGNLRGLAWGAVIAVAIMTPALLWAHQRECVNRLPFHLDGGTALQATGTYCAKFRNAWLD